MKRSAVIFNAKSGFLGGHKGGKVRKFGIQEEKQKALTQTELVTEHEKKRMQYQQELLAITEKSHNIICRAKAVFPFDLFPDEISVDTNQVNVIQRNFFLSATMLSIPIRNIADTLVEVALLFATIKIIDQAFKSDPVTIRFLRKEEALHIRRIIQGLVVATPRSDPAPRFTQRQLVTHIPMLGSAGGFEHTI